MMFGTDSGSILKSSLNTTCLHSLGKDSETLEDIRWYETMTRGNLPSELEIVKIELLKCPDFNLLDLFR